MVSLLSVLIPVPSPAAGPAPGGKGGGDTPVPVDFDALLAISPGDAAPLSAATVPIRAAGASEIGVAATGLAADVRQPLADTGTRLPPPTPTPTPTPVITLPADPVPPPLSTRALLMAGLAPSAALPAPAAPALLQTPPASGDAPPSEAAGTIPPTPVIVAEGPRLPQPAKKLPPRDEAPRRTGTNPAPPEPGPAAPDGDRVTLLAPAAVAPEGPVDDDARPLPTADLAPLPDPDPVPAPAAPAPVPPPSSPMVASTNPAPSERGEAPDRSTPRTPPATLDTRVSPATIVPEPRGPVEPTPVRRPALDETGSDPSVPPTATPPAPRDPSAADDGLMRPPTRHPVDSGATPPVAAPDLRSGATNNPRPRTVEGAASAAPPTAATATTAATGITPAANSGTGADSLQTSRMPVGAASSGATLPRPIDGQSPFPAARGDAAPRASLATSRPRDEDGALPGAARSYARPATAAPIADRPIDRIGTAAPVPPGPPPMVAFLPHRRDAAPSPAVTGPTIVRAEAGATTTVPPSPALSSAPTGSAPVIGMPPAASTAPTASGAPAVAPLVPPTTSPPADRIPAPSPVPTARKDRPPALQIASTDAPAREAPASPEPVRAEPAFRAFAAAMFDAATAATPAAAAAAPVTDPRPLDLTQPRWPQAMVDRIERLRDEASLSDTRIRLVPDALGTIDVAVRRDGETVHVAFHAERAETGRLLAEARPELAALAEARGIRIADPAPAPTAPATPATGGWSGAQTGSGQGFAGNDRAPDRRPHPSTPAAPPRAAPAADAAGDDIRIA